MLDAQFEPQSHSSPSSFTPLPHIPAPTTEGGASKRQDFPDASNSCICKQISFLLKSENKSVDEVSKGFMTTVTTINYLLNCPLQSQAEPHGRQLDDNPHCSGFDAAHCRLHVVSVQSCIAPKSTSQIGRVNYYARFRVQLLSIL